MHISRAAPLITLLKSRGIKFNLLLFLLLCAAFFLKHVVNIELSMKESMQVSYEVWKGDENPQRFLCSFVSKRKPWWSDYEEGLLGKEIPVPCSGLFKVPVKKIRLSSSDTSLNPT
jgi:hypothetical protein